MNSSEKHEIIQAGEFAHSVIVACSRGKVLASFSKAAYLLTEGNQILWLVGQESPMHTRALRMIGVLPKWDVGESFRFENSELQVGRLKHSLAKTSIWKAPVLDKQNLILVGEIFPRMKSVIKDLRIAEKPQGFGRLIPNILRIVNNFNPYSLPGFDEPILARAWLAVLELIRIPAGFSEDQLARAVEPLVGLGEGLTPSGDDFIGAYFFCLRKLRKYYPDLPNPNEFGFIDGFQAKTNPISYTIMRDLANGHALEPLHEVVNLLLTNQSISLVHQPITQLLQTGHSSGWDLLAGLFCGFLGGLLSNDPR